MGDSWASIVNTPLLPMFQNPSSSAMINNNNAKSHGQTVDLATAKLNDLYGGGNIPRHDDPEKFRRSSKGHMYDNTSAPRPAVNIGVTNNGIYGDVGDLISSQHIVVSQVPSERRQWWRKPVERPNTWIRRSRYANGHQQAWLRFRLS